MDTNHWGCGREKRLSGLQRDSFPISISQEQGPLQGAPFRSEKTAQFEDSGLTGERSKESSCIWLGHATIREALGGDEGKRDRQDGSN